MLSVPAPILASGVIVPSPPPHYTGRNVSTMWLAPGDQTTYINIPNCTINGGQPCTYHSNMVTQFTDGSFDAVDVVSSSKTQWIPNQFRRYYVCPVNEAGYINGTDPRLTMQSSLWSANLIVSKKQDAYVQVEKLAETSPYIHQFFCEPAAMVQQPVSWTNGWSYPWNEVSVAPLSPSSSAYARLLKNPKALAAYKRRPRGFRCNTFIAAAATVGGLLGLAATADDLVVVGLVFVAALGPESVALVATFGPAAIAAIPGGAAAVGSVVGTGLFTVVADALCSDLGLSTFEAEIPAYNKYGLNYPPYDNENYPGDPTATYSICDMDFGPCWNVTETFYPQPL